MEGIRRNKERERKETNRPANTRNQKHREHKEIQRMARKPSNLGLKVQAGGQGTILYRKVVHWISSRRGNHEICSKQRKWVLQLV